MKINKKLFAFDLDGTLLLDSKDATISDSAKNTIQQLIKEGHVVCLLTGRPWRATKKIYEELGLDTIVANYNGAYIHNPKDYSFMPTVQTVALNFVARILNSKELKKVANNAVVEGAGYIHLQKQEESHFTKAFIQVEDESILTCPIQYEKMLENPTGVLIEIKKQYKDSIKQISDYFKSRFGDMVSFSYWDTGDENNPILEFTNFRAKKQMALIKIARHYKIPMSDTIAFGDGFNDVGMLKVAGIGVAMANASDIVKSYANVIAKHSNKDDGVAKFIKWYLKRGHEQVESTIYSVGDKKPTVFQVEEN